MAMAFLISEPPAQLIEDVKKDLVAGVDPDTTGHGIISGSGSLDDFKGVSFGSDAKKQAKAYLSAEPGEDLNLATAEIGAFDALTKQGADANAVEGQLRKLLLARFQAYQSKGLDGIAAYARGEVSARISAARAGSTGSAPSARMMRSASSTSPALVANLPLDR